MAKFRKKPVVIEAVQFNGANHLLPQTPFMQGSGAYLSRENFVLGEIVIPTLEGEMRARAGDWIIKGIKGEFYPCKPDIFEATYEAVMM
jgi:hypothetical protein